MYEEAFIGRPILSLQTMLRTVAAVEETLPMPTPDGIYGAETLRCVKAFQKLHGLPQSGCVDYTTWKTICEAYAEAEIETSPAAPIAPSMGPGQSLSEGDSGSGVLLLQTLLHTAASEYANLCDCAVCGTYDSQTVSAVQALQQACGMQQSGCVDKRLWRLLAGLYQQMTGIGRCREKNKSEELKNST